MDVRHQSGQEFIFSEWHQHTQTTAHLSIEFKWNTVGENLPHRDWQQDIGKECLALSHLVTSKGLLLPDNVIARMIGAKE